MNSFPPDAHQWYTAELLPHATALRSWLRQQFPGLADPDNLAQDALLRVWQAHQAGGVRAPRALLYTTARHLALDELRRRRVVAFDSLTEMDDVPVYQEGPTASEAAARNQELALLTEAIQSLPERCRQVLTLRKIYGLSQRDIAAQLGISEHTVEVHVASGMRRCADFLARHGLP